MPIALSVLGCEHPHVPDVLGVIASEPDVRLAAVWNADAGAVPGAISSYAVASADAAISRADAVIVCAPTDERPQLCVRTARAGRPMLVESPVARTAAEGRAVTREIARSRTPAYANLFLRQLPAIDRLRSVIRADLLGRVGAVSASYLSPAALDRTPGGATAWMQDARRAGVGAMGDLGIHLVDALAALGAPARLDAMRIDRRTGGRTDLGGAAVGRWADVPLTIRASAIVRPGELELVINGAGGTAVLRNGSLELTGDPGPPTRPERWVGAPPDPAEGVRAFLARLRSRRLALDGLQHAVQAHEVIERAATL